jgi:hypothetical protein
MDLNTFLISITLLVQVGTIVLVHVVWYYVRQYLDNTMRIHRENLALIRAAKEYMRSAHIAQSTSARTMEEVKQVAESVPPISETVSRISNATAEKVVEKIKSSDSGVNM